MVTQTGDLIQMETAVGFRRLLRARACV